MADETRKEKEQQFLDFLRRNPDAVLVGDRNMAMAARRVGIEVKVSDYMPARMLVASVLPCVMRFTPDAKEFASFVIKYDQVKERIKDDLMRACLRPGIGTVQKIINEGNTKRGGSKPKPETPKPNVHPPSQKENPKQKAGQLV